MRGNCFPEMTSVMWPSLSLQQISAMLHCHFALFVLSTSSHPLFYPLQSAISPPGSFGVHYLLAEVTVKVTAQPSGSCCGRRSPGSIDPRCATQPGSGSVCDP